MENIPTLEQVDWLVFSLAALGLFLFGLAFNGLVIILERLNALEGRRALLVVGGVFGTLLGSIPVIGFVQAVLVGLLFVCSGLPMIVGEWLREAQDKRRAIQRSLEREVDDPAP